ncbi:MAG: hypothetical protein WDW38_007249 [Sanguina aurantia]
MRGMMCGSGNARGNEYSKAHVTLKPTDAEFWRFSWDEMAAYDLPASIKTAMQVSGAGHVFYVGHSQGSTSLIAGLAGETDGFLKKSVRCAALMAPVAFLTNLGSKPLKRIAALNADEVLTKLGVQEFLPSDDALTAFEGNLCRHGPNTCESITSAICGYNAENIDHIKIPTFLEYSNSGTSVQDMSHWAQAVRASQPDVLSKFDYRNSCTPDVKSSIRSFFRDLVDIPKRLIDGDGMPNLHDDLSPDTSACNQQKYGRSDPQPTTSLQSLLPWRCSQASAG